MKNIYLIVCEFPDEISPSCRAFEDKEKARIEYLRLVAAAEGYLDLKEMDETDAENFVEEGYYESNDTSYKLFFIACGLE